MKKYLIMQKVGDRDKPSLSFKDYAFTVPANPMSDRVQMVIEYDEENSCIRTGAKQK